MSDWPAVPAGILAACFGLQRNPANICAIACTCSSWRAAVDSSHINTLCMEASHTSQAAAQQWSSFLKARTSIGHLELRDIISDSKEDQKSSEMQPGGF